MYHEMGVAKVREAQVKKCILADGTTNRQCIESYREISYILVQFLAPSSYIRISTHGAVLSLFCNCRLDDIHRDALGPLNG